MLTIGFPAADIVASIWGSDGRVVNSSQGTDGSIGAVASRATPRGQSSQSVVLAVVRKITVTHLVENVPSDSQDSPQH